MLHTDLTDRLATIRFDHGKAHALDLELLTALRDALRDLDDNHAVRGVLLTGTGTIFSAGVDLYRLVREGAEYIDQFIPLLVQTFHELFTFSRPVVAAINGHAIAGGCVIACACDYRVMARGSGTIGVPELRVGVPFPPVAIEILRFATSTARLQDLVYRGMTYAPDEAAARGLVDEVVEQPALLARAGEVATQLSSDPSARFRITKRQLRRPALDRVDTLGRETNADVLAAWKDPATLDAIRTYLDELKRAR